MDIVVEFRHVQGELAAVRWTQPISFQVERGQTVLIRTNSSMSAPMFRLCLGFSEPSGGTVSVDGKEPAALGRNGVRALRRSLGCMLEPDGLVSNLTLRDNLIIPLVFASGLEYEDAMARVDNMINVMHLGMWAGTRPASLPKEVRQTAALARALCPRPALLLLENPLASVDDKETRRLLSLCKVQSESMLIATHRYGGILHEFADAVWQWDDDGFRAVGVAA